MTAEELAIIKTARFVPGCDPARELELLRRKYEMPEGCGLDTSNGEFVNS